MRYARALLFIHLLLSPVVCSKSTVEVFEYNKVAVLLVTGLALAAACFPWRLRLPRDLISWGVILFFASALVSTFTSLTPWTSLFGAHESFAGIFTILAYTVLYFGTRALVRNATDARRLLGASVIATAVVSTYAIMQVANLDPIHWERVSGFGPYVRPFATMGHANFLAAFLVMAFPLTEYATLRAWERCNWSAAAVFALVGGLSWAAIALSISRGSWLALAVTACVLAFGSRRYAVSIGVRAMFAGLVLMALFVATPDGTVIARSMLQRVQYLSEAATRVEIWRIALRIFAAKPLVGCGLDAFQYAFAQQRTVAYWLVEWNGSPIKAHNEALHILATQGLLGAAAVLVITGGIGVMFHRAWRYATSETRPLFLAVFAGVIGFYVQNMFSFTVVGCGTLFITFAAILSRLGEAPENFTEPDSRRMYVLTLIVAAVLGGVAIFHNIDQWRLGPSALILIAFGLTSYCLAWLEDPSPAHSMTSLYARAKDGSLLVQLAVKGVVWSLALVLIWYGVVLPHKASQFCRNGSDLAAQITTYKGEAARRMGHLAMTALERAIALDPTRELYYIRLGATAQHAAKHGAEPDERRERFNVAFRAFERAVTLVPANSYSHANLGRLLGDMARDAPDPAQAHDLAQRAFTAFDRALALDRNNAYFYRDAATAALDLGDLERARFYALAGADKYPQFGAVRAQLGRIAMIEGRDDDAVAEFDIALAGAWYDDVRSRLSTLTYLATARNRLGHHIEAERAAREAVALDPAHTEAHFVLGQALAGQGRHKEAIRIFRGVLRAKSDHEGAHNALRALGVEPSEWR